MTRRGEWRRTVGRCGALGRRAGDKGRPSASCWFGVAVCTAGKATTTAKPEHDAFAKSTFTTPVGRRPLPLASGR